MSVSATHIVGGELTYTFLGADQYRITLSVYRDCSSNNVNQTGFDNQANVTAFTSNGNVYDTYQINYTTSSTTNIPVALSNPCYILPTDLCVEKAIYTTIITLPPIAGGYTLSYQRCCLNGSVSNISQAASTGITLTTTIPGTETGATNNSSPIFQNLPSVGMCLGADYYFDLAATDDDGDELEYTFCDPLNGGDPNDPNPQVASPPPYNTVNFSGVYDSSYPIASSPAFQVNPTTGHVTGTANQLGMYLVCFCVSDYRNGVLLSTTRRTFQFRVTNCDPNIQAGIIPQSSFCDGMEMTFHQNSINASSYHWDFGVSGIDNDTSNVTTPTYQYTAPGAYIVKLVANPGWPCADTAQFTYNIYDIMQPAIAEPTYECVADEDRWSFVGSCLNAPSTALYSWNFGIGSSPTTASVYNPTSIALNDENASNIVTLTVTDHGCTVDTTLTVINPADPIASIVQQTAFCNGLTYTFEENSQNASSFHWEFNTAINGDNSDQQSPTFSFPAPGTYTVDLIASAENTCPDTASMPFTIYPLLSPSFEVPAPQCFQGNAFDFTALGYSSNSPQITWNFGPAASSSSSNAISPQNISFSSPDTYTISLNIVENGCDVTYTDSVWVAANPTLDFYAEDTEGCPGLGTRFYSITTSETPLGYNWDFGDGSSAITADAVHVYNTPGNFDVTLTIYSTNGCVTTLDMTESDLVHIYAPPTPGFDVGPTVVDILNPTVNVTSTAQGATSCFYTTSDGGTSTNCDFTYDFTQAGRQTITQYVFNEAGCSASLAKTIDVSGFLFFLPNSFTPNNDGINDVWKPEWVGVATYHLKVYNRYGELVFESKNPDVGWTGNMLGGDYYVPDGVYNYTISCEDLLLLPHEFKGNVAVMR